MFTIVAFVAGKVAVACYPLADMTGLCYLKAIKSSTGYLAFCFKSSIDVFVMQSDQLF